MEVTVKLSLTDRWSIRLRKLHVRATEVFSQSLVCMLSRCDTSFFLSNSCWDTNDHSIPWWVIRMPILISIVVSSCLWRGYDLLALLSWTCTMRGVASMLHCVQVATTFLQKGPITSRAIPREK